uniref:Uncharacterized protein n=8 Tax=Pseudomonas aeruginosa TaxID=287 RepID=A0A6H0JNB5_PSEAI|nr:hypothetical protein [Pseudomonas aeruginosa]
MAPVSGPIPFRSSVRPAPGATRWQPPALPNDCLARTTHTSPVCRYRQATTKSASRAAGRCPVEIPRRLRAMPDVTAYRPLEHFQKVELMLELKLREGPSWICLNCGYHLDGSGAQPCPDCGKSRYWTSGWSVGRGHRFSAAREEWENRLRTRSRSPVASTAPVATDDVCTQLRTEVRMLRSAHDDLACSRQSDRRSLQALVKRLLDAAATDSLPRSLAEMETWLQLNSEETTNA